MISLVAACLLLAQAEPAPGSTPPDPKSIVEEPAADSEPSDETAASNTVVETAADGAIVIDEAVGDDVIVIDETEDDEVIVIDETQDDEVIVIDDTTDEAIVIDDAADEVVIIDDGEGEAVVIPEDGAPAREPTAAWASGRTFVKVELSSRLLVDTHFEDTGEDVVEWWNLGKLRIDHRQGRELNAVVDAWVRWGVAGEHPGDDHTFLVLNPRDSKWTGEVELREGFVQWRPGGFDIKVGQRVFVWGKNEVAAAADVLNPLDLRFDPIRLIDSLKSIKVPVFTVDVSHWWGDWGVQVVALPFFAPHRVALTGRDFALAPPGSPMEAELMAIAQIHPSIEDELHSALHGTELPEESPENASLALRGLANIEGWDLAVTAYYGWDRTPRVRVDPDLERLLRDADAILANPQIVLTDPELRDASLGVQQKTLVGEELVRARYKRMWLFALEAQGVIGDLVVRGDVGFSPEQTHYTADYDPVWHPSITGALGLEYTRGEEWYVAVTGYTLAVLDAPDHGVLLGIEGADTDPSARDIAALIGVSGTIRWRWIDEGFELSVNGGYDIQPGDSFVTVDLAYDDLEPHTFRVGAAILDGPAGTLGRSYGRNDFVYLGYQGVW